MKSPKDIEHPQKSPNEILESMKSPSIFAIFDAIPKILGHGPGAGSVGVAWRNGHLRVEAAHGGPGADETMGPWGLFQQQAMGIDVELS